MISRWFLKWRQFALVLFHLFDVYLDGGMPVLLDAFRWNFVGTCVCEYALSINHTKSSLCCLIRTLGRSITIPTLGWALTHFNASSFSVFVCLCLSVYACWLVNVPVDLLFTLFLAVPFYRAHFPRSCTSRIACIFITTAIGKRTPRKLVCLQLEMLVCVCVKVQEFPSNQQREHYH